jgi:hypothetical protein
LESMPSTSARLALESMSRSEPAEALESMPPCCVLLLRLGEIDVRRGACLADPGHERRAAGGRTRFLDELEVFRRVRAQPPHIDGVG